MLHVYDDNLFVEAHFKALEDQPCFSRSFGSRQHDRAVLRRFFAWDNTEYRYSAIGGHVTPEVTPFGRACAVLSGPSATVFAPYHVHPKRFVRGISTPHALPIAAWINPPVSRAVGPLGQDYPYAWLAAFHHSGPYFLTS